MFGSPCVDTGRSDPGERDSTATSIKLQGKKESLTDVESSL